MKIAVLSVFDPWDENSWSGSSRSLLTALSSRFGQDVLALGPFKHSRSIVDRMIGSAYRVVGQNYLPIIMPSALADLAAQAEEALSSVEHDIILALDAHIIGYLKTDKPIFYLWDCTFLGNLEYPWFAKLASTCLASGHRMERRALDVATRTFFSSQWAIDSAIHGYGASPDKVRLLPLASNLQCDRTEADVERLIAARSSDTLELVFLGIDWYRKGGDLALQVAHELNRRGLKTRLTVIGCDPICDGKVPDFVQAEGFLRKTNPIEAAKLEAAISRSHFLIVPSLAEAFGVVFCEASSFGTPSLARRVGGIDAAICDGVSGKLFPREADYRPYCDFIEALWSDGKAYHDLAISSFRHYERHQTWETVAGRLLDFIDEALSGEPAKLAHR